MEPAALVRILPPAFNEMLGEDDRPVEQEHLQVVSSQKHCVIGTARLGLSSVTYTERGQLPVIYAASQSLMLLRSTNVKNSSNSSVLRFSEDSLPSQDGLSEAASASIFVRFGR